MGACGAIETIISLGFLRDNCAAPTLHLVDVDPECAQLDYVMGETRAIEQRFILKNNFAFGGINASLVLKKA